MADPCTKFEVSSVSRCGDFTWGVKFYKWSPDLEHAPFMGDFCSAAAEKKIRPKFLISQPTAQKKFGLGL